VTPQKQYTELSYYTLSHPDPSFIHQYAVDAFTAQQADSQTKPIAVAFALIGLYLHVERNQTGKQVQHVHTLLARRRKQWPSFELPASRGDISVADVIATAPGPERDVMIDRWCASVWEAYRAGTREQVIELIRAELG
jgi:Family of unknown function (DUF5946)